MKIFSVFTSSHYGKKGVKWDINYNFSEKATMIFVAKTVLYENFTGKI